MSAFATVCKTMPDCMFIPVLQETRSHLFLPHLTEPGVLCLDRFTLRPPFLFPLELVLAFVALGTNFMGRGGLGGQSRSRSFQSGFLASRRRGT